MNSLGPPSLAPAIMAARKVPEEKGIGVEGEGEWSRMERLVEC